jgi:hypothetical protein
MPRTNRPRGPDPAALGAHGKAERAPSRPCSGAFRRSPFLCAVSETLTTRRHPGKEYIHSGSSGRYLPGGRFSAAVRRVRPRGPAEVVVPGERNGVIDRLFLRGRSHLSPFVGRAMKRRAQPPGLMRPAAPRGSARSRAPLWPHCEPLDRRATRGPTEPARPRRHARSSTPGRARCPPED